MAIQQNRYHVLDAFRGICACLVALSHFHANSLISGYTLVDFGSVYVDFFFVLSGFVIFANYQEKLRYGYPIGKFMFLRFFRLYPLHFFVLMGFIAVEVLQIILPFGNTALNPPFSAPGETPKDIVANLLLIHSLHVSTDLAFNGPSWSISVEFYAYLFFAILLSLSGKMYKWALVLVGLTSAIALYLIVGELYAKLNFGFLRCLYGFSCGALLWNFRNYVSKKDDVFIFRKPIINYFEIITVLALASYIQFFSTGTTSMLAPLVFCFAILLFSFERGTISKILLTPAFQLLGALSYSIYMLHMFISNKFFELPLRVFNKYLPANFAVEKEGFTIYGQNMFSGTVLEIFYLFVVIGCSYITFRLIEEPFRLWSKEFLKKSENKAAT